MGGTAANLVGQTVGNHKIVARLGEGGMGVVYLGEHALLGRKAAIKVLHPEFSQRPDVVNRFFNEARASALLKHPAIVDIYDFGTLPDQSAYIVMELLEGESLANRLERLRALPVPDAMAVIHQMAKALGAAHARGIVHRDLKPDNVFIVPDPENPGRERVKILDFGIAKLSDEAGGMGKKTRTGALLGTPAYMSPEQCEGAGYVDHRSDLYSMGIILYEMLCGAPPFLAEGFGKILAMHMHLEPVAPRERDPRIPAEVEGVVLRLLVKDKAERLQSCDEVVRAIEEVVASVALFAEAYAAPDGGSTFRVPSPTGVALPGTRASLVPRLTPAPPAPNAVATAPGVRTPGPRAVTPAPTHARTAVLADGAPAPGAPTRDVPGGRAGVAMAATTPSGSFRSPVGGPPGAPSDPGALPTASPEANVSRHTTLSGGASETLQPAAPGSRRGLLLGLATVVGLAAAGGVGLLALGDGDGEGDAGGDLDDPPGGSPVRRANRRRGNW